MSYAPPPNYGQPPKRGTNMALLIGILGCGAFLVFCIFLVAIFAAYKMGVQAAPRTFPKPEDVGNLPARSIGAPERIGDAGDGWSSYRLKDFGIALALPAQPRSVDLQPERWDQDLRDDIDLWTGLEVKYPEARIRLVGYRYKIEFPADDSWVIKNDLSYRHSGSDYQNLKQTVNRIKVDGQPAIRLDYSYVYDGKQSREHDLVLVGPRSVRSISFSGWLEHDKDVQRDFQKCVDSMKYLPAEDDKFGKPGSATGV